MDLSTHSLLIYCFTRRNKHQHLVLFTDKYILLGINHCSTRSTVSMHCRLAKWTSKKLKQHMSTLVQSQRAEAWVRLDPRGPGGFHPTEVQALERGDSSSPNCRDPTPRLGADLFLITQLFCACSRDICIFTVEIFKIVLGPQFQLHVTPGARDPEFDVVFSGNSPSGVESDAAGQRQGPPVK